MRNPSGQIIGIRVRFPSSAKAAVPGSRQGLFIPCGLPIDGPLLICEGPTDTGAALDLGCAVIGRPSCTGGMTMAVTISRGREVVIVGDNDTPGRRGAESLATVLTPYCRTVRTIYPPDGIKDLRQWRRAGMTTKEFCDVVEKVQPRRLVISARRLARSGKEERCGQ
jgi:hypothetical protein